MKIKSFFFVFAISSFVMLSCQKELITESVVVAPPPASGTDSTYIYKVYGLDSSSSGIDTSSLKTFHSDEFKRVVRISDSISDFGSLKLFTDDVYYYNGSNELPEKKVYYSFENYIANSNNLALIDTITSMFTYDGNGRKIRDSSISVSHSLQGAMVESFYSTVASSYQYVPGKIYSQSRIVIGLPSMPAPHTELTRDTAYLDARGNVISSISYSNASGSFETMMTSLSTYDT